ncbi:MAG TPA: class I SAM-dependent methyltransferase [Chloroflexi bacterium]|nr:class I SAM-dependent methyltransferase [Chloroflexota bacterium]
MKQKSTSIQYTELDSKHQSIYTEEASRYDTRRFSSRRGYLHHHYEVRAIKKLLEPLDNLNVLDVPTGTARIAIELQRNGAHVTAADLTLEMLRVGNKKALDESVNSTAWVNANGRVLPFADQSFDAVLCIRFLHLLPPSDWSEFLHELRRVSKSNGSVLVQLFNPFYGGPLALTVEVLRRLRGQPGERFIWPHQITRVFNNVGLNVTSITSYWLPGMGFLGQPESRLLNKLSDACTKSPFNWIGGHFLVLARPQ